MLAANPKPNIQWRQHNGLLVTSIPKSNVYFHESGQFLIIDGVNSERLNTIYYCEVTNALITSIVKSPSYQLIDDLPFGQLVTYQPIKDLVGSVGELLTFEFVGGYRSLSNITNNDGLFLRCKLSDFKVQVTVNNNRWYSFTVPDTSVLGGRTEIIISCNKLTIDSGDIARDKTITSTLTIVGKSKNS